MVASSDICFCVAGFRNKTCSLRQFPPELTRTCNVKKYGTSPYSLAAPKTAKYRDDEIKILNFSYTIQRKTPESKKRVHISFRLFIWENGDEMNRTTAISGYKSINYK